MNEILAEIRLLDSLQQQELLHELEELLEQASESGYVSLMSLRGLGSEIWHGMDAQEYVRQERASWPG